MPDKPRKVTLRSELFQFRDAEIELAPNERIVSVESTGSMGQRIVWIADDRWHGIAVVEAASLGNICRAGEYD